jgi:hypothetical protein
MADVLTPRFDRLQSLAKELNSASDEISKIVQRVETYLNETLHIGVRAWVKLESGSDQTDTVNWHRKLVYGRCGPKFRLCVVYEESVDGNVQEYEETLWANCPRDMKLLAFKHIPELLDEIAFQMQSMLNEVDLGAEAIKTLIPIKDRRPRT